MAVVNASGVVQDSYTYDVYGKPTKTGALANEFDFAGQQTDGTGLQYLRARYYDPATGTFLSRDPLAETVGWIESTYGYSNGGPTNLADPTGLCPESRWAPCISKCLFFDCPDPGKVIESVRGGALSLVKLAGEYSIVAGDALWTILSDDPALTEFLLSSALGAAATLCAAGVVTAGTTCVAAAIIVGVYAGWKISGWLAKDDIWPNERATRTILEIVNAYPGGGLIKAVFDALSAALQPKRVE